MSNTLRHVFKTSLKRMQHQDRDDWFTDALTFILSGLICILRVRAIVREQPFEPQGGGAWVFFGKNILVLTFVKKQNLFLIMEKRNILICAWHLYSITK